VLRYPPDERKRLEREAQLRATQGRAPLKNSVQEPDEVFEDLQGVWDAWWSIGAGRSSGMSVNGLAWTEMSGWCADHGINGEERLRWIRLLRSMDITALTHWHSKK
jgi:hypothetical protein